MEFTLPLRVKVSKNKFFIMNLNNYRNAHHRVLNTAKRNFTDMFLKMDLPFKTYEKIKVHYKIYPASRRLYDGNNVVCIVDKFLMDAMVKRGMLFDDNIRHVENYTWEPMAPDRANPRVEVEIENVSKGFKKKWAWLERVYG